MIRTFNDVKRIAAAIPPKRLAVLAPGDKEFMLAIRESWRQGYIEPVLIGDREKIERVAHEVDFDISEFEIIFEKDPQTIATLGTAMLFGNKIDVVSKGQIQTSYIYRAIIKEESKITTAKVISVIVFWEIPELNRLIVITDPGVNIRPDYRVKVEVIKNAVFLIHLFGYPKPRICVLSGQREIGGTLDSYHDAFLLRKAAATGDLGDCEIIESTSFSQIFLDSQRQSAHSKAITIDLANMPDILVVPNLDAGNILSKMDFLLPVTRHSLVLSSKGPVVIPSRADLRDSIIGEILLGVVIADKLQTNLR